MKFSREDIRKSMILYAVTDRGWLGNQTLCQQVEPAIAGGVTCIQLREKSLSDDEFLCEAKQIRGMCNDAGIPFIVNDKIDIAVKCEADGIHVGQMDLVELESKDVRAIIGTDMILGVSAQTVEQAVLAEQCGADYLGVGAVFSTSTKLDANSVSHSTLKDICNAVSIPIVAIGGISKQNINQLSGTGIDGVAVVSAIFASNNIREDCVELARLSKMVIEK